MHAPHQIDKAGAGQGRRLSLELGRGSLLPVRQSQAALRKSGVNTSCPCLVRAGSSRAPAAGERFDADGPLLVGFPSARPNNGGTRRR